MTYRNFIVLICLTLTALAMPSASNAQAESAAATQRALPVPFGFALGKVTLQEAEAKWEAEGAVIIARGYAAIGAGSGIDGVSEAAAERIVLVDVEEVELEGKRPARFVFFDGVLYSIQTVLRPFFKKGGTNSQYLSVQEVLDLEKQIRQRYGAPNRELRGLGSGKKPNVLIWTFGRNTLTLTIETLGGSMLVYSNTLLAQKADAYKKKALRSVHTKGRK